MLAKFSIDRAENEPLKTCQKMAESQKNVRKNIASGGRDASPPAGSVAARGLTPAELPEYGAEEATEGGEKSLECGGASTSATTTEARFVARDSIVEALEKRSVSVTSLSRFYM